MSINPLTALPELPPMHENFAAAITQPSLRIHQEPTPENLRAFSRSEQEVSTENKIVVQDILLVMQKALIDIEAGLAQLHLSQEDASATQYIDIQKKTLELSKRVSFLLDHLKKNLSASLVGENEKKELVQAEEKCDHSISKQVEMLYNTHESVSQNENPLNRAVQYSSLEDVKALIKADCLPSPLTYHLARAHNNTEAINILDEVSTLFQEDHAFFTKEVFHLFIKNLKEIDELNLSNHPEITDGYFDIPKEEPILVFNALRKLNLQDCSAITDAGIKQFLHCFPYLEEINLDTSRVYEDIEFLIQDEANASPSPEYEAYKKRQSKITKEGIALLAHSTHIRILSLRYCHHVTDDILEVFQDPDNFPRLEVLDLSDCYRITEDTLQKISQAKINLQIVKDRVMSPSVLHLLASLEKQEESPIDKQVLPLLYQAVAENNDKICLSLLVGSIEYSPEQQECSYQERSIEDIVHLAAQQSISSFFMLYLENVDCPKKTFLIFST